MQKGKDLSVGGKLICRALEQVPSLFSICCILQVRHFVAYPYTLYAAYLKSKQLKIYHGEATAGQLGVMFA